MPFRSARFFLCQFDAAFYNFQRLVHLICIYGYGRHKAHDVRVEEDNVVGPAASDLHLGLCS
jgi:hypothetical protein